MIQYMLLLWLAGSSVMASESPKCYKVGFFPLGFNLPEFYGCYPDGSGGLIMRRFKCFNGQTFHVTNGKGFCAPSPSPLPVPEAKSTEFMDEKQPLFDDSEKLKTPKEETTVRVTTEKVTTIQVTGISTETSTVTTAVTNTETETTTGESKETDATDVTETTETTVTEDAEESTVVFDTTESQTETTEESTVVTDATEPEQSTTLTTIPTEYTETTEGQATTTTEELPETTTDETTGIKCPTRGFFPLDDSCEKFVYCSLIDGKRKGFILECPAGQYFNPEYDFCDASYKCK